MHDEDERGRDDHPQVVRGKHRKICGDFSGCGFCNFLRRCLDSFGDCSRLHYGVCSLNRQHASRKE